MHATIEQLTEIRDGLDTPMTDHVQSCEQCQAEMAYLDKLAGQVFASVDQKPSDAAWQRILEASSLQTASVVGFPPVQQDSQIGKPNTSLTRAIYTLAASIAFVGLISVFMVTQQTSQQQQATSQMQASINQLMLNSRGLENVLQQVVVQEDGLSESDKAAAERLYWKLTSVDQALQDAKPDTPEDAERLRILWTDRVEVLNELNRLFYQRRDNVINATY